MSDFHIAVSSRANCSSAAKYAASTPEYLGKYNLLRLFGSFFQPRAESRRGDRGDFRRTMEFPLLLPATTDCVASRTLGANVGKGGAPHIETVDFRCR